MRPTLSPQGLQPDRLASTSKGWTREGYVATVLRYGEARWPELFVLLLYAMILCAAIPYHEPWSDEAQAWQLARSLSLHDLFGTYLGYEGAPGLWHFILWILFRIHVGYTAMHWLCGGLATLGIALLVLCSPFPRLVRLLLPFTYFLLFQYAVVARSYVLVPMMLFLTSMVWKKNPLVLAILLGLLANLALHAAVISSGLALVYALERFRTPAERPRHTNLRCLFAAALLFAFYAFALWTAWPAGDLSLSRVRGEQNQFLTRALISLVWGLCEPWILSVPFWIVTVAVLHGRRKSTYLIPVLLFAVFSGEVYANFWHVGLLVPLIVCLFWITWPDRSLRGRTERAGVAALIAMIVIQVTWSVYAITWDHSHPYSPDLAAARFLRPFVNRGALIAVTYIDQSGNHASSSIGILPYFDHNIYMNVPHPFWSWAIVDRAEEQYEYALSRHPTLVLVEARPLGLAPKIAADQPKLLQLTAAGYKLTNIFCGSIPSRLSLDLTNCHLIFQLNDRAL